MMPRVYKKCPHCGVNFLRQYRSHWRWAYNKEAHEVQRMYLMDDQWSPKLTEKRFAIHVEECLAKRLQREYGSDQPLRTRPWEVNVAKSRTSNPND